MLLTDAEIARVAYEALRPLRDIGRSPGVTPAWEDADGDVREAALKATRVYRAGLNVDDMLLAHPELCRITMDVFAAVVRALDA